ncbi:MAG TPA: hypothetical protein GXZ82_02230 [Firmicutes bacterium]|jgi:hypothetical protein|nr:hypothetical protein [Bacillota bacterium]
MLLGAAKVIITPPVGINLAGYSARDHGSESIAHDLEARIFWLEDTDSRTQLCIVSADLIGFDYPLVQAIRQDAYEQFGLPAEHLLLAASHTHSGPQTASSLEKAGGPTDPQYLVDLRGKIITGIREACSELCPVTVCLSKGWLSGYSINRRVLIDGAAIMAPNPAGIRDDEVSVIIFKHEATQQPVAALFQFTCHPTVLSGYAISPDYPGAARRCIEQALPHVTVGFLQGCCGDVRPNCALIGGRRFRGGLPQEAELFGRALGEEVVQVIQKPAPAWPGRLNIAAVTVELPFSEVPTTIPLQMNRYSIAEELSLISFSGEVCCDYGLYIKGLLLPNHELIPVAYANGLVGYIPPARYYPEGGYEPIDSIRAYSLPSPFKPDIEGIIRQGVQRLVADLL